MSMPHDAPVAGEAAFARALFEDALPAGLAAYPPEIAQARFAVYRNNVASSLIKALEARFPVIERLVGDAFFKGVAHAFIRAHPPRSPVLMEYGDAFPAFLTAFPAGAEPALISPMWHVSNMRAARPIAPQMPPRSRPPRWRNSRRPIRAPCASRCIRACASLPRTTPPSPSGG